MSKRLSKLGCQKYPEPPPDVIKAYIKQRSIIRMRGPNTKILEDKKRKRKAPFADKHEHGQIKKFKIIN